MKRIVLLLSILIVPQSGVVEAACKAVRVPFRIKKPGQYCLKKSLSVKKKVLPIPASAAGSSAAIVIETDGVVLDLQGFSLDGNVLGPATELVGIYSDGFSDISVKNGTVQGFLTGIGLFDGDDLTVEHVRARNNTRGGVWVFGNRASLRDSEITGTGGSTVWSDAFGVIAAGDSVLVSGNFVADTFAGAGVSRGITTDADGFVVDNRVSATVDGVVMSGTEVYRDNLTSEVTTSYTGGIDAGNNQ